MNSRFVAGITLAAFMGLVVPVSALGGSSSISVTGKVLLQKDGQWQTAVNGELTGASHLRTGADGNAIVALANGSVFRLAPNSQVDLSTDGAVVKLERGRLMAKTSEKLAVSTDLSATHATHGEFIVATTSSGTQLSVLRGDATLTAVSGTVASDLDGRSKVLSQGQVQAAGEISALNDQWKGNWKGKGTGDRSNDSDEAAGGKQTVSPDTDVNRPVTRPTPPANTNPPVTNNPPPVNNNPPVTNNPPVDTTTVAGGDGGFPWVPVVIGLAAVGGIIALANNNNDDDQPILVPSPSTP